MLPNTDINGGRLVGEHLLSNLGAAAIAHEKNLPSGHIALSIGVSAMIPAARLRFRPNLTDCSRQSADIQYPDN